MGGMKRTRVKGLRVLGNISPKSLPPLRVQQLFVRRARLARFVGCLLRTESIAMTSKLHRLNSLLVLFGLDIGMAKKSALAMPWYLRSYRSFRRTVSDS